MSSEQYDTDSELEEASEEKEKKAPVPLTKSGIEDLPSTVITSIYCADDKMDAVPDEVFAWKKAPAKVKQPKQEAKSSSLMKNKAPTAPPVKTGDIRKISSSQALKTNAKNTVKETIKASIKKAPVSSNASKDSLINKGRKAASDSKPSVVAADKRNNRTSTTQIKQNNSKIRVNQNKHRANK